MCTKCYIGKRCTSILYSTYPKQKQLHPKLLSPSIHQFAETLAIARSLSLWAGRASLDAVRAALPAVHLLPFRRGARRSRGSLPPPPQHASMVSSSQRQVSCLCCAQGGVCLRGRRLWWREALREPQAPCRLQRHRDPPPTARPLAHRAHSPPPTSGDDE